MTPVCVFAHADDAGYRFDLANQCHGLGRLLNGLHMFRNVPPRPRRPDSWGRCLGDVQLVDREVRQKQTQAIDNIVESPLTASEHREIAPQVPNHIDNKVPTHTIEHAEIVEVPQGVCEEKAVVPDHSVEAIKQVMKPPAQLSPIPTVELEAEDTEWARLAFGTSERLRRRPWIHEYVQNIKLVGLQADEYTVNYMEVFSLEAVERCPDCSICISISTCNV